MSSTPQATAPADQYQLLLTGDIIDGFEAAQAQAWLAKTLKLPPAKAAVLLTGETRCIKRNMDRATAERYLKVFQAQGVGAQIHNPSKVSTSTDSVKADKPTEPEQADVTQVVRTQFFNGSLESSPSWKQSLAAVSAQMGAVLLMICLYAGVNLGLFAFIVNRVAGAIFSPPDSAPSWIFAVIIPAALSLVALLLLLRPLFNQDKITPKEVPLHLQEQQKFAQFIRELSQQIGYPAPDKIYLNNLSGCVSEYQFHLPKLFSGERILSIGLPLVATCNMRQLAAMIAHEITLLRTPLAALAYMGARELSQRLNNSADNTDGWTATVDRLEHKARFPSQQAMIRFYHQLLNLSALILKPFARAMNAVHALSFRHSVFVADHASIALVGSKTFVGMLKQLHTDNHALLQASDKIFNDADERRLANNLPFLVKHFVGLIPQKTQKILDDEVERGETRSDIDYPDDRERIIRAEDLELNGIDCLEQPATSLFDHLDELCQQSTLLYYHNQGLVVDSGDLVDISNLVSITQRDQMRDELSATYFNQWFSPQNYWKIPTPSKIKGLSVIERRKMLNDTNVRIRHATPDFLQLMESEGRLYQAMVQFTAAAEVRKAGYSFAGSDFNFSNDQVDNFAFHYDKTKKEYESLKSRQRQLLELMGTRIFLGVALHPEASKRQLGIAQLQILASLSKHSNRLDTLRVRAGFLPILSARMQERKETELEKKIQRVTRDIREYTEEALTTLDKHACNFSKEWATIGQFVRIHIKQKLVPNSPPLEAVAYYSQVLYGMAEANRKVNSQLAFICRDSEQVNKITPVKVTQ